MTLLNPVLLYGLLLAVLPVVLHLLLRRKPKRLVFPALRLVQQRRKQNLKRIQLRHLWLLLLRILAIGLIVLALTRPSLPAADYAFNFREWLTTALVVAGGVGAYLVLLRKWRGAALPRHVFNLRRAAARGWTTGVTLLALLLLVGWPYQRRISAEIKAPPPAAQLDLPVAAVFLFDTSLSMEYLQEGRSRLDVAKEVAGRHLSELASGSRVAIVESSSDYPVRFQPTLAAAQTRLKGLAPAAVNLPLNDRLRSCLLAQEDDRTRTLAEQGQVAEAVRKDRFLRRVYVFTDLAKSAWRLGGSALLQRELERLQTVNVFVVDVGENLPLNLSVLRLRLSRQQVPVGGRLEVAALVQSVGQPDTEVTLELNRLLPDGSPQQVGRASQKLAHDVPQWVSFPLLTDLIGPVLHGEVRLVSSDPLAMDDARSWTVQVGEPPRVLIVAPREAEALHWRTALAPREVKFRTEFLPVSRIRTADLETFDVVYLINVPQLADEDWSRLGRFVERGGGLGVFTGSTAIKPSAYERAQAQAFLPAALLAVRERDAVRLSIDKPQHPAFRKLTTDGATAILESDVFLQRYFTLAPAEGAGVLASVADDDASPLLVERVHGKGRTVLFASAVDLGQGRFSLWNNLADPTQVGWPFLALAESLTLYLSRASDHQFNVDAGEDVVLYPAPTGSARTFLLKRPQFRQTRVTLAAGQEALVISDAHEVGAYDLVDAERTTEPLLGFSVNPPAGESDLTRLSPDDLNGLFGEGRFQVARSIEELEEHVTAADLGREVFPLVLVLVVVAFLGEHLVANRFYDADEDPAASAGRLSVMTASRPEAPAAGPPDAAPPSSASRATSDPRASAPVPS